MMNSQPTNHSATLRVIAHGLSKGILAVTTAAFVASCAASREPKKQQALVCPQCKMVRVTAMAWEAGHPAYRTSTRWGGGGGPSVRKEHRCAGCQGVITTFFREGKFQHKCSICEETPFTCPVIHPDT